MVLANNVGKYTILVSNKRFVNRVPSDLTSEQLCYVDGSYPHSYIQMLNITFVFKFWGSTTNIYPAALCTGSMQMTFIMCAVIFYLLVIIY